MKTLRVIALSILVMVTATSVLAADSPLSNEAIAFISTWGSQGSAPSEFHYPFDVAVDQEGFVYVTDTGNHRVQKFTHDGTFVLEWGSKGTELGQFIKPTGIAVGPHDSVYVADYFADTIQQFTLDGRFLRKWGTSGSQEGEFDSPAGLAISPDGAVYVIDEYNFRVQKFSATGQFLKAWGKKGKVNALISALNFILPEDHNGDLYYPSRIAMGPDNLVYVADSYNNRIQVFTPEGTFVRKWGGMGLWGGRFRVVGGMAFDSKERLFVADFYNNRIQIFDSAGTFLGQFGEEGKGARQFDGPTALAISQKGDVYVVDFHNHRIHRFFLNLKDIFPEIRAQ